MTLTLLGSGLLLGLMGSTHCLGMCGGLSAALGAAAGTQQRLMALAYNLGRICCYALLGLIAGGIVTGFGDLLQQWLPETGRILRSVAALLVIGMGLFITGWWLGVSRIETMGSGVWRRLQPMVRHFLPPRTPVDALLLGGLWGLLPCGLVYSSLSWAATAGGPLQSATLMAAFGLGTLPAMLVTTLGGQELQHRLRRPFVRKLAGSVLIGVGLWSLLSIWGVIPGHGHHHHAAHDAAPHSGTAPHAH
ncbi:MAG: sulfite exporter TauE/SafE family protein [Spongiibacteraceae bacterium]|jgi:sulfite exporter TauE/SafE|nr:sulfite exporter TauE/SafE family protein [Spongiibacteraceae bacterium]